MITYRVLPKCFLLPLYLLVSACGGGSDAPPPPALTAPDLSVAGRQSKALRFTWNDVTGETEYRLLQDVSGTSGFSLLGTLSAGTTQADTEIYVPGYLDARFKVQACNATTCVDSNVVSARGALRDAIGYAKGPVPEASDGMGFSVELSADGTLLVAGMIGDDSGATGIDGDSGDNSVPDAGALVVFEKVAPTFWAQQAYIKASNADSGDGFGWQSDISGDGNTLVVSAEKEDSSATGVNGNETSNFVEGSGAAYVFVRDASNNWSQEAYLKASNTGAIDQFGWSVAISGDGNTIAVSAVSEDSLATGINGDQNDNQGNGSGAVYVFTRDGAGIWSQQAYIKASNTQFTVLEGDRFGFSVDLSDDGNTLAVGAFEEDSGASGINGDQTDNSARESGAVYVFVRDGVGDWSQQAYIKSSNPGIDDFFGYQVALSGDSNTLAVGAFREDGGSPGVNGDQADNSVPDSGAVYVFVRDGLGDWSQQAYIKSSNPGVEDLFGRGIALTSDGDMLAVGAVSEDSVASGIDGDQFADSELSVGAVYTFMRNESGIWSQQNYIKAPNPGNGDNFGDGVALSSDGWTLAVGAYREGSASTSGGDQSDNSADGAGAVYIY